VPSWPVDLRRLCSSAGIVNVDLASRIEPWRERMHVEDEPTVGRVHAKIRCEARARFNGRKGAEEAADRASGDNQPTCHRVPKQFDFHVDSRADGRERLVQHARLEMNRHQDVDKNPPLRAKIPSTTERRISQGRQARIARDSFGDEPRTLEDVKRFVCTERRLEDSDDGLLHSGTP